MCRFAMYKAPMYKAAVYKALSRAMHSRLPSVSERQSSHSGQPVFLESPHDQTEHSTR
jgi:hypothetical protein